MGPAANPYLDFYGFEPGARAHACPTDAANGRQAANSPAQLRALHTHLPQHTSSTASKLRHSLRESPSATSKWQEASGMPAPGLQIWSATASPSSSRASPTHHDWSPRRANATPAAYPDMYRYAAPPTPARLSRQAGAGSVSPGSHARLVDRLALSPRQSAAYGGSELLAGALTMSMTSVMLKKCGAGSHLYRLSSKQAMLVPFEACADWQMHR